MSLNSPPCLGEPRTREICSDAVSPLEPGRLADSALDAKKDLFVAQVYVLDQSRKGQLHFIWFQPISEHCLDGKTSRELSVLSRKVVLEFGADLGGTSTHLPRCDEDCDGCRDRPDVRPVQ